jgi:hypothetical protein
MERKAHFQGILCISPKPYLSGSQVKEPSLKAPLMESLAKRCPTTRALLHSSIKVLWIRAPSCIPGYPQVERGPQGERCLYPETFVTYLPGSPVKELPLRPPLWSLFRESCSIPRAPFIQLSKFPLDKLISFWIKVLWDFVQYTKHVSGEIAFVSLDTLLYRPA